jgi:hypothetical protein
MTRPTLEVADILRASGSRFFERHASRLAYQHRKVMELSSVAALRRWAGTAISVSAAAIRPSPITRAASGTAPSVKATHAPDGWPRARPSYCPCLTSTSSSHCLTSYQRLCFRTSACSTISSSAAVPPR